MQSSKQMQLCPENSLHHTALGGQIDLYEDKKFGVVKPIVTLLLQKH